MWMWVPTLPAGWGPLNTSTWTGAVTPRSISESGPTHRYVGPEGSFEIRCRPRSKSSLRPDNATSGNGASGFVSIAVTKIAAGVLSGAGTLL